MLAFLHQMAYSVSDGTHSATFHYESSHAALLVIICMRCETWTTAKVLTLKHLTGSIIFTRACVFNELLFHMLHETLYGFLLKLPWIFQVGKQSHSFPRGCFTAEEELFLNSKLWWQSLSLRNAWVAEIRDGVVISYVREARGWWGIKIGKKLPQFRPCLPSRMTRKHFDIIMHYFQNNSCRCNP